MFITLLSILTILDTAAVVFARYYVEQKKLIYMWLSLFFFAMSAFFFVKLMPYESTAIVSILWISLSTIIITFACYFLFNEKISYRQGFGMLVVFVGMGMLSYF